MPASSSSSRRAASSSASSIRTKPPGSAHFPAKGSTPRLMRSTFRSSSSIPNTTQSTVKAGRGYS